jgi:hypothetical protein
MQTHCTATGVQPRQNADHSFAGYSYTNRQALEGAPCTAQSLGKRSREGAQQTDQPQRESSGSEDCWMDQGGREGTQQTGGSCGTGSLRSSKRLRAPGRKGSSDASRRLTACEPLAGRSRPSAFAVLRLITDRIWPKPNVEPAPQPMNTEKTNGESTPPAITSFSPARSGASSPRK